MLVHPPAKNQEKSHRISQLAQFQSDALKISQVGLRVNRVAPETAEGILATSFEKAKRRPSKKSQEVREGFWYVFVGK